MNDATQPEVTLLPCPFCGGEAKRITLSETDGPENAGGDVICCIRCDASSHVEFGYKENLVHRWNTRIANQSAPTSEVREFTKAVLHGDAEHRAWLTEAAEQWLADGTVPPPRLATPPTTEPQTVADGLVEAERFLTAYVSEDAKVIGIEHETEADWHAVQRAHEALRDRLNVRLAEREKCPFRASNEVAASGGEGERT